jgi:glycine/D-amino acid oxidase-like deaminating enzyme
MKSSVRAAVIGGGVVGASVLYHLAKIGWTNVMLIEKSELTSGSTWHAAGGMHTFNGEANISRLQKYTIDLYREIEALSGQSCGLHPNGGLMLAATQGELDSLKLICSRARYLGMQTEMISLDEATRFNPLIDTRHFIGALWRADGGHCDPSGTTQAYVKAARTLGATVERFTRVQSLTQRSDASWDVVTDKGTVHAEHVVNCGGLWAREVGHMVGIELPVLAMEHHYLLTEDIAELKGREHEIVNTTDYAGEIYMRQERGGALIGSCCPMTSSGLRRISKWASGTFRRWDAWGSARRSTDRSPSPPTAIRWSGRCAASGISGSPARSWLDLARAAASASCCRGGWRKTIRARTSSPWMSRGLAHLRRRSTPPSKCRRTTRAASAWPIPTKSCLPPARCAARRSTSG